MKDNDHTATPTNTTTEFKPGQLVQIHSLKSPAGKRLNGLKGIVIRYVSDQQRYQVKVEDPYGDQTNPESTSAIRPINLRPKDRSKNLPSGMMRGHMETAGEGMIDKLAELLVYETDDYTPSDTMLMGYAAMACDQIPTDHRMAHNQYDMEQIGGMVGISKICELGEGMAISEALFTFTASHIMHLDVFIMMITRTPFIGDYDEYENDPLWDPFRYKMSELHDFTPDQTNASYVAFMSIGPLYLLKKMSEFHFGSAFFAVLQRHELYHLLMRRMLRLVARETMSTKDGKGLGRACRKLIPYLVTSYNDQGEKVSLVSDDALEMLKKGPVSRDVADCILRSADDILAKTGSVISEVLEGLLVI